MRSTLESALGVATRQLAILLVLPTSVVLAQEGQGPTGWEPNGLPAINYDSDEGFGYGVLLELYNYGSGGYAPYRFTLQPTVFLTTGGRRDFTLFFDAPHLLPAGWANGRQPRQRKADRDAILRAQ